MEDHHEYEIKASWTVGRSGVAQAEAINPSISFSPPPEFQGHPGQWTPEHLLVAAVASCYVSTMSAIAELSKLEFLSFGVVARGLLQKQEGAWRFTEIRLRPALTITREEDRQRATRLLEKAEKSCLIARSLACPIILEPAIKVEEELVVRH